MVNEGFGDYYVFKDANITFGSTGQKEYKVPVSSVSSIAIRTLDGNDKVTLNNMAASSASITVDLGTGDDTLDATTCARSMTVVGGDGADMIRTGTCTLLEYPRQDSNL